MVGDSIVTCDLSDFCAFQYLRLFTGTEKTVWGHLTLAIGVTSQTLPIDPNSRCSFSP